MKSIKIIYWSTTVIVSLMMVFTAYSYLTNPAIAQAFQHLGFPGYFRVELAIAKLIGAVVLLSPVNARIKEWTYAGFAITFISAFIAHAAMSDKPGLVMTPIFLLLLAVSYISWHKLPVKNASIATA